MRYKIYTLGCKVNQFESAAMESLLGERGHQSPGESTGNANEKLDAVIINTCAVTAESGRKSRQAVRRERQKNPGAVIAVCGCFSQLSPEEIKALQADIVYGSGDRTGFVKELEKAFESRQGEAQDFSASGIDDPFKRSRIEDLPVGSLEGRTRAYLKIEDGCDNFCAYCIIPYARGRVRSLSPERAGELARELSQKGYRELVITGIEISSYGKDLPGKPSLIDALEQISKAAPSLRLRLGSLEPTIITRDFVSRLKALGNICPQFHLSLQSGSDEILRLMRRKYDAADFYNAASLLRESFAGCAITADLICGFPGETEKLHREALEFIEKCGFSSMHIFPYSIREGTKAEKMEGHLDNKTKARRAKEASLIAEKMQKEYLQSQIGERLSVLFETEEDGFSRGHSENYCLVETEKINLRRLVKCVEITGIKDEMLVGKVIEI
ncbi:tRNA (N(6)-L-threonylcarbamoyladenosine(37)-C(2))-methylthiotransferase MtaB [Clostridiaceae bacterium OttesenSCG-928-D20]|nr:tRNA (N(6)-L-threonylcarbamoyladenosine(37)-C(2))-methylthiotransferase MtaB [Clostridiaceae bacterium OttesenSCG-928-D20]